MCICPALSIDWSALANIAVAAATGYLAWKTRELASSTETMAREAKEGNERQIGVQTWLNLEERFDSPRFLDARRKLAHMLMRYNEGDDFFGNLHNSVMVEVLELFESIGAVYNLGLLDKRLAATSFGYYATGWWGHARLYIENDRKKHKDDDIYVEFQKFAEEMAKVNCNIDLLQFVKDEMALPRLDGNN